MRRKLKDFSLVIWTPSEEIYSFTAVPISWLFFLSFTPLSHSQSRRSHLSTTFLPWFDFSYFFFLLFTVASFSLSYRSTPSCTSSSRNRESTRLDGTFHSSILFFLLWLYTWHKEKCIYGIFQINFSSFFFFVTQKRIEI